MSWLRDHFYYFVLPALKKVVEQGNTRADYIRGSEWDIPPLAGRGPTELRKLMALCKQLDFTPEGVMAFPPNHNGYCFIRTPPPEVTVTKVPVFSIQAWSWMASDRGKLHFNILRKTLLAAERIRRERGFSRLLLPGRDVWPLKVMAAKRRIPATYIPEMSRNVCYRSEALRNLMLEYGIDGSELVVDTGFAGSIVRAMGRELGKPFQFCLMSQQHRLGTYSRDELLPPLRIFPDPPPEPQPWPWGDDVELVDADPQKHGAHRLHRSEWGKEAFNANRRPNQVFPNRRKARTEALETEYLPKYHKQGTVVDGRAVNYLSSPEEIILTAILTSNIWRGNNVVKLS